MTTLNIRSYQGEVDKQAIFNLINACETVERLSDKSSIFDIKLKLNYFQLDNYSNVCLWE